MHGNRDQITLIALGLVVTALLGVFLYRELFPEYKLYQNDYIALEEFRAKEIGQPPPPFEKGIKQIVLDKGNQAPPTVDRCISCHVALQYPYFSPTVIAKDDKGNILRDEEGIPLQIPNDDYIWTQLDKAIASLEDSEANRRLEADGRTSEVAERLRQATSYRALKEVHIGEQSYAMDKVLIAHPLIGKETHPFELHPMEEYGCTSCHNGNGQALTADKAHGPVYDGRYEAAETGHTPHFLASDPINDPLFSRVFNHKPSHALLFQTTPLYVGNLVEAKCAECHRGGREQSDVLLKTYHKGESLFFSQGCYACHRIAGLSRGGVGPELTYEGNSYPWFVKESIVWPQADLKTSSMPNFQLDHPELEALVTFLLAQHGRSQAIAEPAYKKEIHDWEGGEKKTWELPIAPDRTRDLSYGMTLFATEGCASCHRLKGFESNVGYAAERTTPSFASLDTERTWFTSLIPEEISSHELVNALENHSDTIDKKLSGDIRTNSLIEEIEKSYPGLISSFYPNFRFAERAQDHSLSGDALAAWRERVHRTLMVYIQEYGLGRLICPRPNWSGVYRSDQWLMDHFRNPASVVPNSLMPLFPFDDSKFYALTFMLDTLGKKNRDALRLLWKEKGFDPAEAFQIYCSQCHGSFREGNGPVSHWIYPLPKNLTNADFLRNLTKEQALLSITHGVKGTPMPPWGETPRDKLNYDAIPILDREEIGLLVNWLFSQLPGNEVIASSSDVPKWHYSPQDVLDELKGEGNGNFAIESLFDKKPNEEVGGFNYYIDKRYYTPQNLLAGEALFDLHCAQCHGREADGNSIRAGAMHEAKPRMLINVPWLKTRDDIRLLRSIKYGVSGTAMTPQGDQTDSLQRLQLVMYIRSLSTTATERDLLQEALYSGFDENIEIVERARATFGLSIAKAQQDYDAMHKKRLAAEASEETESAASDYRTELLLRATLRRYRETDGLLLQLQAAIRHEKEVYAILGNTFIEQPILVSSLPLLIEAIESNRGAYTIDDSQLTKGASERLKHQKSAFKRIEEHTTAAIASIKGQIAKERGKIATPQQNSLIDKLQADLSSIERLQKRIVSDDARLKELHNEEHRLYEEFVRESKALAADVKTKP